MAEVKSVVSVRLAKSGVAGVGVVSAGFCSVVVPGEILKRDSAVLVAGAAS